ncbi:MAG: R3H domain-containing nucleic acid-binding protein [bacterium]
MNPLETIQHAATTIVSMMVPTASVTVVEEDGMYKISIVAGEQAPAIIGRHGDTIRSIQKVLEVIAFNAAGTRVELVVNVNDYREKQVERLQSIAAEIAGKVQVQGSGLPFRGLNSYERRIIHEYITNTYPELTTYSVGEGRARELVIDLKTNSNVAYTGTDAPPLSE